MDVGGYADAIPLAVFDFGECGIGNDGALYQKQYQKIGILFAIILAVSMAFFLIYPESAQVMMHSQRGEEAWTKVGEG